MLTRRMFLFDVLVALGAAGCTTEPVPRDRRPDGAAQGAGSPSSPSAARIKLNVAKFPGVLCQISWFMALEKGFFSSEGLDVEFLNPDSSKPRHHAFQPGWVIGPAGQVRNDAMVVEYPALQDMIPGVLDYYVVAGEHSGCRQLIVPAASAVRSVADLKGKRIGTRPAEDTLVWDTLIGPLKAGSRPTQWIRTSFEGGDPREFDWIKEEFAAGRIDAYVGADPVPETLIADGIARRLASNTWTPPLNGWYCCMLAVRKDLVDTHPDLPRRFTRAIRQAAAYVEGNAAQAVALAVTKGYLPPFTRQDLSARLLGEYVWATTGRIREDLERYIQLLMDAGRVPTTTPPSELVKRVYRSGD